jgi:hypothetical protein
MRDIPYPRVYAYKTFRMNFEIGDRHQFLFSQAQKGSCCVRVLSRQSNTLPGQPLNQVRLDCPQRHLTSPTLFFLLLTDCLTAFVRFAVLLFCCFAVSLSALRRLPLFWLGIVIVNEGILCGKRQTRRERTRENTGGETVKRARALHHDFESIGTSDRSGLSTERASVVAVTVSLN